MATDAVVEAIETVITVTQQIGDDLLLEVMVDQATTASNAAGDKVVEVLTPAQPPLNSYGLPIVLTTDGGVPEYAALVLLNGATAVTMPLSAALVDGRFIEVKNIGSGTATVGLNGRSADGSGAAISLPQWASVRLVSYGSDWLKL